MHRPILAALVVAAATTAPASAQNPSSIAARVAAAPADGVVEMHFAGRPGVCGDGRSYIGLGRSTLRLDSNFDGRYDYSHTACVPGPVRVVMRLRGHDVDHVRTYAGGDSSSWRPASTDGPVTNLGAVDSRDAAAYLLDVARRGSGRGADDAMVGAVLADRAVVWPALLAIARDTDGRSRASRSTAGFWLSRFASAARDGHGDDIIADRDANDDEDGDDGDGKKADVRGQAVFALSQLPRHEGIPSLIEVARTHRDPAVRRKAIFWLGQSDDPRALDLFEELLRKK